MNRLEALTILGLSQPNIGTEVALDAYEDKVFEHANFFMLRAFVPKLAMAKIKRLEGLRDAAFALNIEADAVRQGPDISTESIETAVELDALISAYHASESVVKRNLASTLDASAAVSLYSTWITVFNCYAGRFISLYEAAPFYRSADETAKISEQADPTALVQEFRAAPLEKPMLHRTYSRFKKILS